MTKSARSILLLLAFFPAGARAQDDIPIYVFINMHSEQSEPYHQNRLLFERNRSELARFANMLATNGAMFNFQSDWTFLEAVTNYDRDGHLDTGNTNIIAWMHDTLGFEIDPHNHRRQTAYNLADSALLPVVGRFGLDTNRRGKLEQLLQYRSEGLLCTGRIYTCSVAANMRDLTNATFFSQFDDCLQEHINDTNVHWLGIQQIVDTWTATYASTPNLLPKVMSGDLDGGGMNDGWEVANFCGLADSTGIEDRDGNAASDAEEYVAHTSPTNALDYFQVVDIAVAPAGGERTTVTWLTSPGLDCRLDAAAGPDGAWSNLLQRTAGGSLMTYTNDAAAAHRIFRVRVGGNRRRHLPGVSPLTGNPDGWGG